MASADDAFLKAIAEGDAQLNPAPRWVYADWLDEQSRYDESTEQRSWTAAKLEAKAWLTWFADECGGTGGYSEDDDGYRPITYEMVVQAGHDYVDHGDYFTQFGSETAQSLIHNRENCERYWRSWEIVTGRSRIPSSPQGRADYDRYGLAKPFSCSC